MKKLNVALVGLSFGLEFVAIYCKHPDIDKVYVVDKNEKLLNIAKERYSIPDERCFTDLQDVLDIPEIDAVHLVTPPATHAPFSVRVLNAGKHCGCTIPMGMSIQELNDIIAARKASGKNYMFMETTIFQREFLYIQELYKKGELGRLQYMTCAHYQDMEGWPEYWEGFPPLMHPTHAVAPCLMLAGHLPDKVYARGSGKIRKELADKYGCPFAFESAFISLQDSDVTIEMERFLYGVARSYSECFRVYGENESFEWQQLADEDPVLFTRTGELEKVDILDEDSEKSSRGSEIVEKRIQKKLQIVYFIIVPRFRFTKINIDMYHWQHIPIGTLYSRVSYSFIITQRSLLTQAPFFVWTYLITDQLYRICSVLFVSCFLVNFCFLSLTVFEEVHSYLWEQCVC